MLDQPSARLHQPLLQAGQRPCADFLRQNQSPPQVSQIAGENAESQRTSLPLNRWQDSRVIFTACLMFSIPPRWREISDTQRIYLDASS
jgi:hypothetical protein